MFKILIWKLYDECLDLFVVRNFCSLVSVSLVVLVLNVLFLRWGKVYLIKGLVGFFEFLILVKINLVDIVFNILYVIVVVCLIMKVLL